MLWRIDSAREKKFEGINLFSSRDYISGVELIQWCVFHDMMAGWTSTGHWAGHDGGCDDDVNDEEIVLRAREPALNEPETATI